MPPLPAAITRIVPAVIDRNGGVWRGDSFDDLRTYLVAYAAATSCPAGPIVEAVCACGTRAFELRLDDDEGCAQRRCTACAAETFIADSAEYWDDAAPGDAQCPCGGEIFQVGIAFSLTDEGEVRWVSVGGRCVACGLLGTYVDWKIDYSPTGHLLDGH